VYCPDDYEKAQGTAVVEAHTVLFSWKGAPLHGVVILRTSAALRTIAEVSGARGDLNDSELALLEQSVAVGMAVCCGRWQIDPRADVRLTHLQIGTNPAQAMARKESDWVSDISATGSIRRQRQQGGVLNKASVNEGGTAYPLRGFTAFVDISECLQWVVQPFAIGSNRPILLKKSEFQTGRLRGWSSLQNLFTTLGGFSVLR
jgi:hypothetical protein